MLTWFWLHVGPSSQSVALHWFGIICAGAWSSSQTFNVSPFWQAASLLYSTNFLLSNMELPFSYKIYGTTCTKLFFRKLDGIPGRTKFTSFNKKKINISSSVVQQLCNNDTNCLVFSNYVKHSNVTRWKQGYITPPPPYFILWNAVTSLGENKVI